MPVVNARVLREAIGMALKDRMNADTVEAVCIEWGLAPPAPPDDVAFNSKRAYVVRRLAGWLATVRPNHTGHQGRRGV